MPIVSGGGGGGGGTPFNGGTITTPLVIHSASDSAAALDVRGGSALTQGLRVQVDPAIPAVSIEGLGGYQSDVEFTNDVGTAALSVGTGGIALAANSNIVRNDIGGAAASGLMRGGILNAVHSAPADGALNAGDSYLWFDQTNGAAKLMVKGKTADGTVVAASINLA